MWSNDQLSHVEINWVSAYVAKDNFTVECLLKDAILKYTWSLISQICLASAVPNGSYLI